MVNKDSIRRFITRSLPKHLEKANEVLVARRQKQGGMHWSLATSDGLAALRTLVLNGGWERYWMEGEVLALVEAQAA